MSIKKEELLKTLYVTDLDGTLLHNDKSLSQYTISEINRLIEQGMLFTYATARSFQSAYNLTKDIKIKIPVITRNGTVMADQEKKKETQILCFSEDEVKKIKAVLNGCIDKKGFVTSYQEGKMYKTYYKGDVDKGLYKYIHDHSSDKRMRAINENEDLYGGTVTYVTLISDKDDLEELYAEVMELGFGECHFQKDTYGEEYWLEICPTGATKAKAILKCKEMLGCDRLVVFGDSTNDLSMFEIADISCAVENGLEKVKQKASYILGSNECDSVAKYLQESWRV